MKKKLLVALLTGYMKCIFAMQLSTGMVTFFTEPQYEYQVKVDIDTDVDLVTIAMRGPAVRWFGIAFGATQMADEPYAIIANSTTGNGTFMERQLGDHGPGTLLSNILTLASDNTVAGIRTIVVTRPITGSIYNFPTTATTINVLWAEGMSRTFGFHAYRSPGTLAFYTNCPVITGTTPGSKCGPGSVTIASTASMGTLRWYASPLGGASLATGSNYITPAISTITTYYVEATHNGCASDRIPVAATILSLPQVVISASSDSVCAGTTVSLTASGAMNYLWGNGVQNPVLSFVAAKNVSYSVLGIDTNGCFNTAMQTIKVRNDPTDINRDGVTSMVDLNLVLLQFGKSCN